MYRQIKVTPYDDNWPALFEDYAAKIRKALGANCLEVHHIGSTSVEGLAAKPVIDILPVVKDITKVDDANQAMQTLGYEVNGEFGMLFRRYFYKNEGEERTVNVHVYEQGNPEIERYLLFRDHMRTHPDDKQAYGDLKTKLAKQHPDDIESYLNGKSAFVESIDSKTGFKGLRIVEAATNQEWRQYHKIRKELIFDVLGVEYNPGHPTLSDSNHKHIVLIKDTHIVGVIHLEFLSDDHVAIRPFAIDKPYQNQGLGSAFYKLIEKWLKQKGVKLVQLHANSEALNFYMHLGFEEMEFFEEDKAPPPIPMIDLGKYI